MELNFTDRNHHQDIAEAVTLKPGQELTVLLSENVSTGYLWEIESCPDNLDHLQAHYKRGPTDDEGLVGSSNQVKFVFRVQEDSPKEVVELCLVNHRPWLNKVNDDYDPAYARFAITVVA